MDTTNLTDDQIDFLAQCEADFANRYTDKDDDFSIVMQIGMARPPIIEPWRPKGGNYYRRDRHDGRDRDRDHRDGHRDRNREERSSGTKRHIDDQFYPYKRQRRS